MKYEDDAMNQFDQISEFVYKRNSTAKAVHDDSYFREHALDSVQKRNERYCTFLDEYVDNYNQKAKASKGMKRVFFIAIMILLFGMVSACIIAFVNISGKRDISYSDVATVVTAVGGIVASFIVLPKVMAENLFPAQEEDRTAEIFDSMIKYDLELEKFYAKQEQPKENVKADQAQIDPGKEASNT